MKNVLYWKECINDLSEFEPYSETIQALLLGEYSNLRLEKLHIQSITPIYSIRHSQDTRILFTTFQNKICLLEVILNHDYAKSRFLRNRHTLSHHLEHLATIPVSEPDLPRYSPDETLEKKAVLFHHHFIELNSIQEQAIQAEFPIVLHGPAGSGKTTVALELLQRLAKNTDQLVIYLTESAQLKNYIQNLWLDTSPTETSQHVKFLTYQQFLEQFLEISCHQIVDIENFYNWHRENAKLHKISPDALFKEFRIISGFQTLEEYQAFSKRLFNLPISPNEVWRLFDLYQRHLGVEIVSKQLSFISRPSTGSTYLIIDEAQDFSFAQLKTLLNFSKEQTAVLLGDHQILFDDLSRFPFIKQFFFHHFGKKIEPLTLTLSYRCSQKVSDFANLIIQYKYSLTGGRADKIEMPYIEPSAHTLGCNEWIQSTSLQSVSLQQHTFPANWAIINFSDAPHTSFTHPIVFTPSECKGLEFETVILWKPFERHQALLRALPSYLDISQRTSINRAKSSRADSTFLNDFNTLITAVTRAQHRLIIVDSTRAERSAFIKQLHEACESVDTILIDRERIEPSEVWFAQANYLLQKGFETQAKRICVEKLNLSEAEFYQFKEKINPSAITKTSKSSPTNIIAPPTYNPTSTTQKLPGIQYHKELEQFYRESDYQKAIQDLFATSNRKKLLHLLNIPYPEKTLLELFMNDEDYLKAFVCQLSVNIPLFSSILSIIAKLSSNISPAEESHVRKIFNFLHRYKHFFSQIQHYGLFHAATFMQDVDLMVLCLNSGVPVDLQIQNQTALLIICKNATVHMPAFTLLVNAGASFNIKDKDEQTPLHFLSKNNHIPQVEYALQAGVEIDTHTLNKKGKNAVLLAATHGHFDCYKIFINHGASPFLKNQPLYENYLFQNEGIQYLEYALERPDLFEFFNQNKIDILISAISNGKNRLCDFIKRFINFNELFHDSNFYTIHHIMQREYLHHIPMSSLMSPSTDLTSKDKIMEQISHQPIHKNFAVLQFMLDHGMNINQQDEHSGATALHMACFAGSSSTIKFLLKNKADIHIPTYQNIYPIDLILYHNLFDLIANFIENGLNPQDCYLQNNLAHVAAKTFSGDPKQLSNIIKQYQISLHHRNQHGQTPLLVAASSRQSLEILKALHSPEIDLNACDIHNKNLFYYLEKLDTSSPLKYFYSQGMKLCYSSQNTCGPLILALEQQMRKYAFFLSERVHPNDVIKGGGGAAALHLATQNGYLEIVRVLLKKEGINPNQAFTDGTTALHIAAHRNCPFIAQELLSIEEINPNPTTNKGVTPLFIAAQNGHLNVVQALLNKAGIDPNHATNAGTTPLFIAAQNGHPDVVQALLNHEGINPNQALPNGATPLFIAAQSNQIKIVEYLLQYEKIDTSQPLESTPEALKIFAKTYEPKSPGLIERIEAHIHQYKENFPDATLIEVTPAEIACLMRHSDLFELFPDTHARRTMSP